MCNFYSAVVLRNGDVLDHDATDRHSDLVRLYELPDDRECRHFAKVEFRPASLETLADLSTYTLRLDEATEPGWWEEVRDRVEEQCRARVGRMIVTSGKVDLILGGRWILAGDVEVDEVRGHASIEHVGGSASIKCVWGSVTINHVWGSASIECVRDNAIIRGVGGSATIEYVEGSAVIEYVGGSVTINHVWGSATVNHVEGSVTIKRVEGSATVKGVWGETIDAARPFRVALGKATALQGA